MKDLKTAENNVMIMGQNNIAKKIVIKFFLILLFLIAFSYVLLISSSVIDDLHTYCQPYFWDETPCQILSSKTIKNQKYGYELRIKYSYSYNNKYHMSYDFKIFGNDKALRLFSERYPKGLKLKCYVNQDNPGEAVIYRKINGIVLVIIILSIFISIYGAIVLFTTNKKNLENGLLLKFFGVLVFGVIWNSILISCINLMIQGWGFFSIIIIPLVFIGAAAIIVSLGQFLLLLKQLHKGLGKIFLNKLKPETIR